MNRIGWLPCFAAALLFLGGPFLVAAERMECAVVKSVVLAETVRYCALLPASFDSQPGVKYPVLYQLHGLGQNEQSVLNLLGWNLIDDVREKKSLGEFVIVTPAADSTFYVNSRDGHLRYEDFFIREFIPYIEHRYRGLGVRAGRAIGGVSMGGYGALHYAFKYPQLFTAVAANSAALIEKLPQGVQISGFEMLEPFGHPPDAGYWDENTPFTLARKSAAALRSMKIYFDCGTHDDYGFEEGASVLHRELEKLGIRHEFHLYPGRHNLSYFTAHLPAAIGFEAQFVRGRPARKN